MGVMIRHYNNKELSGYVRVSVGKPEQTDVLMNCLNSMSWFKTESEAHSWKWKDCAEQIIFTIMYVPSLQ